ncbi:hypothetical protein CIG19_13050 [Enterobacterales bacterium CwR94]|nr:hypothetical protein CIG19_13050 [Enterobacterales bacterium CwR94]
MLKNMKSALHSTADQDVALKMINKNVPQSAFKKVIHRPQELEKELRHLDIVARIYLALVIASAVVFIFVWLDISPIDFYFFIRNATR